MAENMEGRSCPRSGCDAPVTRRCLDAVEPWTACPYFLGEIAPSPEAEQSNSTVSTVRLPEGQPLTVEETSAVMHAQRTRVIVVGGATGSGKTTLITSIYESFLDAPFAGCLFAGSATLPGFEMACHPGRVESGREAADTERTKPWLGIRFYHLQVVPQASSRSNRQLLIADMSGELFREARDASDDARKLSLLRRADRLTFLLDGEKLASSSERAIAYHDARGILRALAEEGLFGRRTELDLVFAKWDVVEREGTDTRDYLLMIQGELSSAFASKVARLRFFSIAARPDSTRSPFAFGVAELFREWVGATPQVYLPRVSLPGHIRSARSFGRFGEAEARRVP